jgi:hypothetical protein
MTTASNQIEREYHETDEAGNPARHVDRGRQYLARSAAI